MTYKQGKISLQCKRILDSEGELLINIRKGMAAIFFYFKEKKEKESKNRKWCVTIPEIKNTSPE